MSEQNAGTIEEAWYQSMRVGRALLTLMGASLEMALKPIFKFAEETPEPKIQTSTQIRDDEWHDHI